ARSSCGWMLRVLGQALGAARTNDFHPTPGERIAAMRRALWLIPVAGLAALVGLFIVWRPSAAGPGEAAPVPEAPASKSASLPVSEVILYSSGVGYFQRSGKVEGDARVDLAFPVQDVNDLLKSLVVRDLGGGQVTTVAYDSHDPVEKTL